MDEQRPAQREVADEGVDVEERPRQAAYDYFAKFNSPVVREIIDAVYDSDAGREALRLQQWNGCMAAISG